MNTQQKDDFRKAIDLLKKDVQFEVRVLQSIIDRLRQQYNIGIKEFAQITIEESAKVENDLKNYILLSTKCGVNK